MVLLSLYSYSMNFYMTAIVKTIFLFFAIQGEEPLDYMGFSATVRLHVKQRFFLKSFIRA